jgi:hypothetical protein
VKEILTEWRKFINEQLEASISPTQAHEEYLIVTSNIEDISDAIYDMVEGDPESEKILFNVTDAVERIMKRVDYAIKNGRHKMMDTYKKQLLAVADSGKDSIEQLQALASKKDKMKEVADKLVIIHNKAKSYLEGILNGEYQEEM